MIKVFVPWVEPDERVLIAGDSKRLGNWSPDGARELTRISPFYFSADLIIKECEQWKLIIIDSGKNVTWEIGDNRISHPLSTIWFRGGRKATGISTPLFSLRSSSDNGIGDFNSLKLLIKKIISKGHKVVELLPINDTLKNPDPYQIASVSAINPVYICLDKMGVLGDVEIAHSIADRSDQLNYSQYVEWDDVLSIKWDYFRAIYNQDGNKTINSKDFKHFLREESEWLIPYALFCYFTDKYNSNDYTCWESFSTYSDTIVEKLINDGNIKNEIYFYIFLQYHAYKQFTEVKKFAEKSGVMLKCNIPIGIAKNSVEIWQTPNLFNKEYSIGSEPEGQCIIGQKWPFHSLRWKNSKKYWDRRMNFINKFFDICSIDHIIGYFRIWEIPDSNSISIKGHYSPQLGYTQKEIRETGFSFDRNRDVQPYITREYLKIIFGDDFKRFGEFFRKGADGSYCFKQSMSTPADIVNYFRDRKADEQSLRDGLIRLQEECLFVNTDDKFIPRIAAQYTNCYSILSDEQKNIFNRLYDQFYYSRNENLWRKTGIERLRMITGKSTLLFCAEDLGDTPDYVHEIMNRLGILSLEVERISKNRQESFGNVYEYPYMSVSTTSTLDMKPIKEWWKEERKDVQNYWCNVLCRNGMAPEKAGSSICREIVNRTIQSSSALAIIPIHDWLSTYENCPDFKDYNGIEKSCRISTPNENSQMWNWRIDPNFTL